MQANSVSDTNSTSVFTQRGGCRIGGGAFFAFNATWPFASIEVQRGQLVLRCLWWRYVFPASSITRLSRHDGVFSTGLRIHHSVAIYPEFIVFWTFNLDELQRQLRHAGFNFDNRSD